MVRRDDTELTEGRPTGEAVSRCIVPAGESPVRVIAGEPDSRPHLQSESRAEHVGVKAMFLARESGWARSLGGVWGAEGAVVLVRVMKKNVTGGKDPGFSQADEELGREGLLRVNAAKHPVGHKPNVPDKAPGYAARRMLSVRRMREIRTYGLNGGLARGSDFQLNTEIPAGGRIYQ